MRKIDPTTSVIGNDLGVTADQQGNPGSSRGDETEAGEADNSMRSNVIVTQEADRLHDKENGCSAPFAKEIVHE